MPIRLPHVRNTLAFSKGYEPLRADSFAVTIIPPQGLIVDPIVLDHVRSVNGAFDQKVGTTIERKFQTARAMYANNDADSVTEFSVVFSLFINDASQLYAYKFLQSWAKSKFDPETGVKNVKSVYGTGKVIIERGNRDGSEIWTREFNQVQIADNLPDLPVDFDNQEALDIEVPFVSDWYQERLI